MMIRQRLQAAWRAYKLGADIGVGYGVAGDDYAPAEYGDYIATSNPVYVCVNKRAKMLPLLPPRLYRLNALGEKTEVTKGNLWVLLRKANPQWTFKKLLHFTEMDLCLWGSAVWFLERGASGRGPVREMWRARPDRVTQVPHATDYVSRYTYRTAWGQELSFAPEETVYFAYPNPIDEFQGLSPLGAARLAADVASAAQKSNRAMFANGLNLGGIIKPKAGGVFTPQQAKDLEEDISRRFRGADKAHKWAVLRFEAEMQPGGITPKDAEYLGALNFSLEEVCRAYDMPLDLVGGQRTYQNVEAALKAMWTQCLLPEAGFIADELTGQLLPLFPGEADVVEFDSSKIHELQEDREEVVNQIATLNRVGVPLNALLNEFMPSLLPDAEGYPWGDAWWAPGGVMPVSSAEAPARSEPLPSLEAEPELVPERGRRSAPAGWEYGGADHRRAWGKFVRTAERQERKITKVVQGLFKRQEESVKAKLEGAGDITPAYDPFDREAWGKTFRKEIRPVMAEIVTEAAEDAIDELGLDLVFDVNEPRVRKFLDIRAQRFAEEVNETTWRQLKDSIIEGLDDGEAIPQLMERVSEVMGERIRSTPETIARTEAEGALNGGALEAWRQSGVVEKKQWLSALDDRVREPPESEFDHRSAHGETVPIDEPFVATGEPLMFPGDDGSAGNIINCRCSMRALVEA